MPDVLFKALDVLPRHAYPFLWADYVELLCLCNSNGMVSKGNIHEQTEESLDVQRDAGDSDIADESTTSRDDRLADRWNDIAGRFKVRAASWPVWPFTHDGNVLRSRFDPTDQSHRLYVALLIASSLRLCSETRCGEVTSAFEEISYHWMRRSLSNLWEVRPFGAHQTLPNAYTGTLRTKLEALASDIFAILMKPASDYDPSNTGDGGIDLVAWQCLDDQRGNIPVIFGQCACSPTDWEEKQLDVTPAATEAHLSPQHPGAAYCFVPHDLQHSDKSWQRAAHVKRTVVIDRARILRLFHRTDAFGDLPAWSFVDEPAELSQTLAA